MHPQRSTGESRRSWRLGATVALLMAVVAPLAAQQADTAGTSGTAGTAGTEVPAVSAVRAAPPSTSRATPVPASPAAPFAAFSASAQRLRDSLVTIARAQVGRRYRTGGTTPDQGFDCSGLVRYVLAALAVDVPRTSAQQARQGLAISRDTAALRPGDLLTFGSSRRISHIGIYVGDGRFVHASSVAGRVIESPLNRQARRVKPWQGARRVIALADSTTTTAASH